MGEYLAKYNLVIEKIYQSNILEARNELRSLLLSINDDMKTTNDVYEKVKAKKAIIKLLPVLEELDKNEISEKVINILRLDKNKFISPKKIDTINEVNNNLFDDLDSILEDEIEKTSDLDNEEAIISEETMELAEEKENIENPIITNVLTPKTLDDYIGQTQAKKNIMISINAAKKEDRLLDHLLICSPYGLGKTTIANIIANEMNLPIYSINSANLKDVKSLSLFFSKINERCIIFIDEIHELKPDLQTLLLSIMTEYKVSIMDKKGIINEFELPQFTLIGATTQAGELLKPLINRFTILELVDYTEEELRTITLMKFNKLGYEVSDDIALNVAKRSRGIPRTIEIYVKGIKNLALNYETKDITENIVNEYFDLIEIDEFGLGKVDLKILKSLNESEGAVGLITLESKTGIQKEDLEYRYEPYLIKIGFIEKTEKGRIITPKGIEYIDKSI